MRYTFNNREVHNPIGKALIMLFVTIGLVILIALCVVSLPIHFVLYLLGFQGFWDGSTGNYNAFNFKQGLQRR